MAEAAILAGKAGVTLASLCDEANFDRYIDTVANAIAGRFALKVHKNVVARRMAFTAWIAALARMSRPQIDYRSFIAVCATLIDTVARHRTLSYSAMIRDPGDSMVEVAIRYPNEVTALAAGAALYDLYVSHVAGGSVIEPLSPLVMGNAAANLAGHPKAAAARFRELLRLSTPWS
jgi:hypothetical protein